MTRVYGAMRDLERAITTHLFIICPNNSGSTFLNRALATCRATWNLRHEGQRALGFAGPRTRANGSMVWASEPRWLDRLADPGAFDWAVTRKAWYFQAFARDESASVFVTKAPSFLLHVGALARHFRNAKFLFMVRNPYAVGEGICRNLCRHPLGPERDLPAAAARHVVACFELQRRNLDVWGDRGVFFTYEAMCGEPQRVAEEIRAVVPELDDLNLARRLAVKGRYDEMLTDMNARQLARLDTGRIAAFNRVFRARRDLLSSFGYGLMEGDQVPVAGKRNARLGHWTRRRAGGLQPAVLLPVIHIGYHKTATTWLQHRVFPNLGDRVAFFGYLTFREALVKPSSLEFDPTRARKHVERLMAPHAGAVRVFSAERLSGSPHSGGHDAAEMASRIKSVFGEAKILIVVREQVSMLVSNYKQYIRMGGTVSLEEYLEPPRDLRVPLFRIENFCYHHLVEHHLGLFGEARVLVLPYELLERSRERFVARLLDFIGVDGLRLEDKGGDQRIHPSMTDLQAMLRRRVNVLSGGDTLHPVWPKAPRIAAGLHRLIDALGPADAGRRHTGPFRARAERVAGNRYLESNRILQRHVAEDLGSLGYRL